MLVPVAMNVGVQTRVTVGNGASVVAVGEIVAVEVFGGVVVLVNVGNGLVVGARVVVLVGEIVGLGGNSVTAALVGLAGGRVGDELVGLGVVGDGATVCVAVATLTAAKTGFMLQD
jgi:hypothetical protein